MYCAITLRLATQYMKWQDKDYVVREKVHPVFEANRWYKFKFHYSYNKQFWKLYVDDELWVEDTAPQYPEAYWIYDCCDNCWDNIRIRIAY